MTAAAGRSEIFGALSPESASLSGGSRDSRNLQSSRRRHFEIAVFKGPRLFCNKREVLK